MDLLKVLLLLDIEDAGYTSLHNKHSREKQFISFDLNAQIAFCLTNINSINHIFSQNLRCFYNCLLRFSYFFRKNIKGDLIHYFLK